MPHLLLLLPVLIQTAPAEAQATQVQVIVRDIPGDPLAGARITLEGNQRGLTSESNELGMVSFGALPPGKYRLRAEKEGFRPLSQELQLDGAPTRRVELRLVKDGAPKKTTPPTP